LENSNVDYSKKNSKSSRRVITTSTRTPNRTKARVTLPRGYNKNHGKANLTKNSIK